MDYSDKTKEELIAELELLRSEIAAQKQEARFASQELTTECKPPHLNPSTDFVLRHTQTLQEQQRQQQFQKLVSDTALKIHQFLDLEQIFKTTVTNIRHIIQSDRVIIYQFLPNRCGIVVEESVSDPALSILKLVIPEETFPYDWVEPYCHGRTRNIDDIYTDPNLSSCHQEFLAHLQVRANLVAPIVHEGNLWGLLIGHHCTAPRYWLSSEIQLMKELAIQVAIAIQQATLVGQLQTELKERQKVETSLRQQKQTLSLFFEYAPAGVAMLDRNMCYVMASHRWLTDYNLTPLDSILGRSHYEIFPETSQQWKEIHQRCLAGASAKSDEDLFIGWDGTHHWIRWEIRPWYDNHQQVCGIIIFAEDISDRKKAEIALKKLNAELEQRIQQSTQELIQLNYHLQQQLLEKEKLEAELLEREKLLDGFFNAASDANVGLCIIGTDLRIIKINQALANINTSPIEDNLGKTPKELFPDLAPIIVPLCQKVCSSKQSLTNIEISGIVPSEPGVLRHWLVSYFPIFADNQNLIALGGIIIDITEQKKAEATLREFQRRWLSLLDNVQLIVVELNRQGYIEYANPFFLKLTQYTEAEVLRKQWFTHFIPTMEKKFIWAVFIELLEQEKLLQYNHPILTRSGQERMISWTNTILRDIDNQLIGVISIGEDITERHQLAKMKDEFISVVSHELRTPLTSMQAGLSLISEKIINPSSPEGEITIEIVTGAVDRLVRLVNDILDLSRLESGKIRLEKRTFQIADFLNTAIAQIQEMAKQEKITVHINVPTLQVQSDHDRLLQVLINLLSNAIKFSPPGSSIWLSVEQKNSNSPYLLFKITDQGRGIPADKLEKIFERFYQVDASDSRTKQGTGLGLTICRSIIQQHGGSIWAESVLGKGSTFYFTIPMDKDNNND